MNLSRELKKVASDIGTVEVDEKRASLRERIKARIQANEKGTKSDLTARRAEIMKKVRARHAAMKRKAEEADTEKIFKELSKDPEVQRALEKAVQKALEKAGSRVASRLVTHRVVEAVLETLANF